MRLLRFIAFVGVTSGCFDGALPAAVEIACEGDSDCPGALVCKQERCRPLSDDDQPPAVVVTAAPPPVVQPGAPLSWRVAVDEGLAAAPVLDVEGASVDGVAAGDEFAFDVVAPDEDGVVVAVVRAVDLVGNVADVALDAVVVDGTAPAVVDVSAVGVAGPGDLVTVAVTFSEVLAGAADINVDGATVAVTGPLQVFSFAAPLLDGSSTLTVNDVVDAAGNVGAAVDVGVLVVDATAPALSAVDVSPHRSAGADDVVIAGVVDDEDAVVEAVFGSDVSACVVVGHDFSCDVEVLGVEPEGRANLSVVAHDRFLNQSDAVAVDLVIDYAGPELQNLTAGVTDDTALRAVKNARAGATVDVVLSFDERVVDSSCGDADAPPANTIRCSFVVDAGAADGPFFAAFSVFDDLGNGRVYDVDTGVVVDNDAPVVDGDLLYLRAPAGVSAADPQPRFNITASGFAPDTLLIAVDGAGDDAFEVARGVVDDDGGVVLRLPRSDRDRVFVRAVDDAGNASDVVLVDDVEFVARPGDARFEFADVAAFDDFRDVPDVVERPATALPATATSRRHMRTWPPSSGTEGAIDVVTGIAVAGAGGLNDRRTTESTGPRLPLSPFGFPTAPVLLDPRTTDVVCAQSEPAGEFVFACFRDGVWQAVDGGEDAHDVAAAYDYARGGFVTGAGPVDGVRERRMQLFDGETFTPLGDAPLLAPSSSFRPETDSTFYVAAWGTTALVQTDVGLGGPGRVVISVLEDDDTWREILRETIVTRNVFVDDDGLVFIAVRDDGTAVARRLDRDGADRRAPQTQLADGSAITTVASLKNGLRPPFDLGGGVFFENDELTRTPLHAPPRTTVLNNSVTTFVGDGAVGITDGARTSTTFDTQYTRFDKDGWHDGASLRLAARDIGFGGNPGSLAIAEDASGDLVLVQIQFNDTTASIFRHHDGVWTAVGTASIPPASFYIASPQPVSGGTLIVGISGSFSEIDRGGTTIHAASTPSQMTTGDFPASLGFGMVGFNDHVWRSDGSVVVVDKLLSAIDDRHVLAGDGFGVDVVDLDDGSRVEFVDDGAGGNWAKDEDALVFTNGNLMVVADDDRAALRFAVDVDAVTDADVDSVVVKGASADASFVAWFVDAAGPRWQPIGDDTVDVEFADPTPLLFERHRRIRVAATTKNKAQRGTIARVTVDDLAVHLRLRLR